MMSSSFEAKIEFLAHLGVDETSHSGSCLLHHLRSTHDLLKSWGAPTYLCDAGLFHSVYGTETFDVASLPRDHRQRVQQVIGVEAETLSYLFGVMYGEAFYDVALREANLQSTMPAAYDDCHTEKKHELWHRLTFDTIPISHQQLLDLINISFANILEQVPRVPREYTQEMCDILRQLTSLALPAAQRAFTITVCS